MKQIPPIKVADEFHEAILAQSQKTGISISEAIRRLLHAWVKDGKLPPALPTALTVKRGRRVRSK